MSTKPLGKGAQRPANIPNSAPNSAPNIASNNVRRSRPLALPLLCLLPALMAQAQSAPDAGSLLQQNEATRLPALPPKTASPLLIKPGQNLPVSAQQKVDIKQFELQGHQLLSSEQLQAVLRPFLGTQRSLNDLQAAAAAVAAAYAQAGWLARCSLPPQDITEGVVRLQIIEAKFSSVQVDGSAKRFQGHLAVDRVLAQQPAGAKLRISALDRALALINDLPGVNAQGSLTAGAQDGETALLLKLNDTPLYSADVRADNHGSRSTGTARLSGQVSLNGALGLGDAFTGNASLSEGSNYLRVGGSAPLGAHGWRGGVNASLMNYKLVGADFAVLKSKGSSHTLGLEASYPILRSHGANLAAQFSAERKQFTNEANGARVSRYHSTQVSGGLSAVLLDELAGGGANSVGLVLSEGTLNLGGSPNFNSDALSTRSHGPFTRLRYQFSRQQALGERISAFAGFSGQTASRNLDSSEKFYLGGAQGVRAYPANEAGGSWGQLANMELRASLPANLRATAFYDWGRVRINVDNNFPNAPKPNAYALKGLGLSLAWSGPQGLALQATLARRVAHNPNPGLQGKDQDGSLQRNRLWLQASLPY